MSAWEQHVRDTRARTLGSLAAVYTNQDSVYNNHTMNNSQFKAGQGVFTCRVCSRETRDVGDNGSVELCHECYEVAGAENTLSDAGDTMSDAERASIQAYIYQMNRAAVAKGGVLPPSELGPEPEAAPIPAADIPQAEIPAFEVTPKRPPHDRGQGRKKLPPGEKLEAITVRLSPAHKEKLKRLGRDWLAAAINRAHEPKTAG